MTDKQIEQLAELIFQKILDKQKEWAEESLSEPFEPMDYSNRFLLTEQLIVLNIKKQKLIEEEKYEKLIVVQKEIDEIKNILKTNED